MSQQCTIWQKNHLNLANIASSHHVCLKVSKTAQMLYERGGDDFFPTLYIKKLEVKVAIYVVNQHIRE